MKWTGISFGKSRKKIISYNEEGEKEKAPLKRGGIKMLNYDYNGLSMYELKNALHTGEINEDDIPDEVLDALEEEEAEETRREYAAAYASYVAEWA